MDAWKSIAERKRDAEGVSLLLETAGIDAIIMYGVYGVGRA